MKMKLALALFAGLPVMAAIPAQAIAQSHDYTYRGRDGHYYRKCKHSNGTTGLVAGGAGGALVGNALGGGVLGTVAGGVGGALLGKHLDKKHDQAQNRRNGC